MKFHHALIDTIAIHLGLSVFCYHFHQSKQHKKVKEKIENFFDWIKGAELVELKECNTKEDPVRPELDLAFRQAYGRKIYGLKDEEGDICAIMCFAFTNQVPKTVEEMDILSKDAAMQAVHRACLLYTSPSPRD